MKKEIITAEYNGHKIIADILTDGDAPKVFCMHGAGISNRKIFDPMRNYLSENNISSCALDFIGYGETCGELSDSSLRSRTEQAGAIIEKAKIIKPLTIIAGSMAGYNAIKLTEIYPVDLLVLSASAVYRKDAYEVPFGDKFSALIREPKSWDSTDAWDILEKYKGKIIVLAGEKDDVIPREVTQKIYDSAINASHREIIIVPYAPHRLVSYLGEHTEDLKMAVDKIIGVGHLK